MSKKITLSDEEFEMLQLLVEESLVETSPTPNIDMKSLAEKIQLSEATLNWIDRTLNRQL
jgi:hypothetical protein